MSIPLTGKQRESEAETTLICNSTKDEWKELCRNALIYWTPTTLVTLQHLEHTCKFFELINFSFGYESDEVSRKLYKITGTYYLKCDWRKLKDGKAWPFSHLFRPFNYHSVEWMAQLHPLKKGQRYRKKPYSSMSVLYGSCEHLLHPIINSLTLNPHVTLIYKSDHVIVCIIVGLKDSDVIPE